MQSMGIWAPRGDGTAAGGTRQPMVFQWFSMVLDWFFNFLLQVEGAREGGSGGMQSMRITGMLCFTTFFNDFQLTGGRCSRWEFPPCGRLAGNACFTKVS